VTRPALALEDVEVSYHRNAGLFGRAATVRALKGVSLGVAPGECVGVVGESGSGKSTVAQIAVGLLKSDSGRVILDGAPAPANPRARKPALRRFLQLVPQDPYGSLDPMHTVAGIVAEGLEIHRLCPAGERRGRAAAALSEVGLGEVFLDRRPHQLSGGQRQRVAIARALAVEPEVLVLDEPTSALDLVVQAQVLNLLLTLQQRRGLSYLLISHDIDVVRHLAHRVYVLAGGEIVEEGPAQEVLRNPRHAYTRRLVEAAPTIEPAS
jgi:ABC-type glutathione transport system ATPase component